MFLWFGFTKVPNNMILMSNHCIDPYYCTTLCVHVLQRVGGPGEPRALLSPTLLSWTPRVPGRPPLPCGGF